MSDYGFKNFETTEIQTDALRKAKSRRHERFLKGPIPLSQITRAAQLPGRALSLLLAIHHQTALSRKSTVTLPKTLLHELGIGKDAKARGLKALESVGLISVHRATGCAVRISLAAPPSGSLGVTP